jgi:hypothetical protein
MTANSPSNDSEEASPFWVLTTFFPYSLGIIIFISTARQFMIFKEFNLPIFNFLEVSDLTIRIVNDLYGLFVFVIFSLIIMFLKDLIKKGIGRKGFYWGLVIITLIFGFVGFIYWANRIHSFCMHFIISCLIYLGLCTCAFTYKSLLQDPLPWLRWVAPVNNKTLMLTLILIFSFLFCKSLSRYVVSELKVKKVSKGTVIKFRGKQSPIVSSDTVYYIGNTTKYVFVYNESTGNCASYSMDEIASIETGK